MIRLSDALQPARRRRLPRRLGARVETIDLRPFAQPIMRPRRRRRRTLLLFR